MGSELASDRRNRALRWIAFGVVSTLVLAVACFLKSWHWLSFFGLACLLSLVILGDSVGTAEPGVVGLLALDALAVACAVLDLARARYGAPGRVVAWATCALALAVGALLWGEALGPGGLVGSWLRYR